MKKFDNIDGVVTDIILSIGASPESRIYPQMTRLLLRGLDDLAYNLVPTTASKKFQVEENGTVAFPSDMFKVNSIGLCLSNGAVAVLGKLIDSPIAQDKPEECTCDGCSGVQNTNSSNSGQISTNCANCVFNNYIEGDAYHGELYAFVEEGYAYGRYFINDDDARIEFDSRIKAGQTVIVKYQVAVDKFSHKFIAADDYELVRTVTLWRYYQSTNRGLSNDFRNMHRMEISKKKQRLSNYTYLDWIDAITGAYNNSVR
jgi:hypothetical protein